MLAKIAKIWPWIHWGFSAILVPLAPLLLSWLFRVVGDGEGAAGPQFPLWNSEIPFFTIVSATIAGQMTRTLAVKLDGDARGLVDGVSVAMRGVAVLAAVLVGAFYVDQHVKALGPRTVYALGGIQLFLAVLQLGLLIFVRYGEVEEATPPIRNRVP